MVSPASILAPGADLAFRYLLVLRREVGAFDHQRVHLAPAGIQPQLQLFLYWLEDGRLGTVCRCRRGGIVVAIPFSRKASRFHILRHHCEAGA
jgi:hypothetical protein